MSFFDIIYSRISSLRNWFPVSKICLYFYVLPNIFGFALLCFLYLFGYRWVCDTAGMNDSWIISQRKIGVDSKCWFPSNAEHKPSLISSRVVALAQGDPGWPASGCWRLLAQAPCLAGTDPSRSLPLHIPIAADIPSSDPSRSLPSHVPVAADIPVHNPCPALWVRLHRRDGIRRRSRSSNPKFPAVPSLIPLACIAWYCKILFFSL